MASVRPDSESNVGWRPAIVFTFALAMARLVALFRTPLNLYPDEAQYWLWSRTLDFGYYSKPPMVAWAIWATTAIGGSGEAWVRLSAVLFQAGAMLAVFAIGRRLYGDRTGLAAAALYGLTPAVQLSAMVAATDAPLLFFLGLTILAYSALQDTQGRRRLWLAAAFGAALGLAFLSKYAAVFAVIGVALHLVLRREARAAWTPPASGLAVLALAVVLGPNLAWNAAHGFATFHHTAANAAWGGRQLFNIRELAGFLFNQVVIFGPIPFGALLAGTVLLAIRKRLQSADLLLLCFIVPPFLIVTVQAFISRANANWSGASYLPGAILAAAFLMRWRAKGWLTAAFATQAVVAALFLAMVVSPPLADKLGAANSFKRAKAWKQTTELILQRAGVEAPAGLTAIAVNNRFLYYSMAYYGRDTFDRPGTPPLTAWLLEDVPQNQAETSAPLTPDLGGRVLAVAYEGWRVPEMMADFQQSDGLSISRMSLDRKHTRRIDMFVGSGFQPRPRDPKTGLPLGSSGPATQP
jgi:4-amino-4-deoxy-L-arabinose transferase-like glycosyltransferase